jgi:hypothetical protein
MRRLEELQKATDRIFNAADTAENDYLIALLILGCILQDEALDHQRCNLPGYPIFVDLLRERNDALDRRDLRAVAAIKADAKAALEYGRKRALEVVRQRLSGSGPLQSGDHTMSLTQTSL